MIGKYQFKEVCNISSFQEVAPDLISFPVSDSTDFPCEIRRKTEEIIDIMICDNSLHDLSKLHLDARIEIYFNKGDIPVLNIGVFITDENDLCIERDFAIHNGDALYEPFKRYFMWQLEKHLFVALV